MTILDQIVESKQSEIKKHRSSVSLNDFDGFEYTHRSTFSFKDALQRKDGRSSQMPAIIAEFKRGSPSKGHFAPDATPTVQCRAYEQGGAAACSILTDSPFFHGSLQDLSEARSHVHLALLRKDFIIDPYQVFEAKAFGADAILLIERILSDTQINELVDAAKQCHLGVLMELDSAEAWSRIEPFRERLSAVGINSRNLATFDTDADSGFQQLDQIPSSVVRVLESGIHSYEPLLSCAKHQIDAALIGEALMRAPNPATLLQTWMQEVNDELE